MSELLAYLHSPFVLRAMAGVLLIGVNAASSGVFASFRSLTFLVSGASHAALAGAALVIVLDTYGLVPGVSPIVGGALFAVGLGLLAAYATYHSSERAADPAIGVGFAFSMALAVALISFVPGSATRVWGILLGDLLLLTPGELWLLAALTLLAAFAFWLLWNPFLFIAFDMDGAKAFGIHAEACNYLLFGLIGLSSAVIMKGVGAIVVFAMLVTPAATAMLLATSVRRVVMYAFAIAVGSGLVAIVISFYLKISVSALAALLCAASYLVARAVLWMTERWSHRSTQVAR